MRQLGNCIALLLERQNDFVGASRAPSMRALDTMKSQREYVAAAACQFELPGDPAARSRAHWYVTMESGA